MFGTGPFITCAILFQTVDPAGPQALYGYFASGVLVFFDSFVWGELSSIWPYTGGSYAYLSEMYGKDKWGSLIAFLYLWQLLISGPLEVAGGFVAAADYEVLRSHMISLQSLLPLASPFLLPSKATCRRARE